ncbi:hypothetical protein [Nonomuraea zeae]|uniref:Uncharacterized protein n=1 Tax=Nonomuraea zeae TaxID=1642303 RepID=A0A5S4GXF0_9ACTN|nr:hypothetical protein [Nonomuraea zeae]TMR37507.1 hypothetical protein ETD85_07945 [Nonomuraea zeae]
MGLLRLTVLMWLTMRQLRKGARGPSSGTREPSPAAPEPARTPAVGRRRSLRLITGMSALTALLGVAAWSQYQTAAPVPLFTRFNGNISVSVTVPEGAGTLEHLMLGVKAFRCAELQAEGMVLDDKELATCGPDTYDVMMTGLAKKGAPLCFDYHIEFDGDARLSEVELNDKPYPEPASQKTMSRLDGRLCRRPPSLRTETVHIRGRAREPLVISRGYTTVLAAPGVMYGYQGNTRHIETDISWELGRTPPDSVVESSTEYGRDKSDPLLLAWNHPSPETIPEPEPRLEWRADPKEPEREPDPGGYVAGPHARLMSIPRRQAAERALFWAGLLAGAAVSTLAWTGELLLENRRSRR